MASQGSDKLKAILAQAQEKARAAQAAQVSASSTETHRVEALLDRNEALPDPRALARMYRSKDLVERLPDDEDSATPTAPVAAAVAEPEPAAETTASAPAAPATAREAAPARPPLSPSQIREVMEQLREQFTAGEYQTYEAKPNPVDVIPMPEEGYHPGEAVEEPSEIFYIVGAVVGLVLVAVFVLLALNGPLRYRAPAAGPSPGPSASAPR